MIVCKFGGSSLSDAMQIKKVKDIVLSNDERKVVVVSAPGKSKEYKEKITDLLISCFNKVRVGESCEEEFTKVRERFLAILDGLSLDKKSFSKDLCEIEKNINSGYSFDYVSSRGEYLNAKLISKYFGFEFLDTFSLLDISNDGKVLPSTYEKIQKVVKDGKRYVVPGYYGKGIDGNIKVFSRGGSDITGSIFSSALNASMYENWTDVSGVYNANPSLIKKAKVIPTLSYREEREYSSSGASVFHEEAILPCVEKNIPINIRNTNAPKAKGTIISEKSSNTGVIGISSKSGFSSIFIRKMLLFKESGVRHKILSLMHIYGINPCYTLYGTDSISWYFKTSEANGVDIPSMCRRIKEEISLDEVLCEDGYSIIGILGENMIENMAYVDALVALKENGIKTTSVSLGGSYLTFTIGLKTLNEEKAVEVIFNKLFS